MKAQTKESQEKLSAQDALNILIEGNDRFVLNKKKERNLQNQVLETSRG